MRASIIIPAYNEEKYIGKLLKSIKAQTFKDYEIIVALAPSSDKTKQIAQSYGAKVVRGGLPARGRNRGAKAARGEIFFFLDADVILNKRFLESALKEMRERKLRIATCELLPMSPRKIDHAMHDFSNTVIKVAQYTDPLASGACTIVDRSLFREAGGYDETLKLSEDHEFGKRASKISKLRVLKHAHVRISVRRLTKEGRFKLILKYLKVAVYTAFNKKVQKDIIDYEFGNFGKKQTDFQRNIKKIRMHLKQIKRDYSEFLAGAEKTKKKKKQSVVKPSTVRK